MAKGVIGSGVAIWKVEAGQWQWRRVERQGLRWPNGSRMSVPGLLVFGTVAALLLGFQTDAAAQEVSRAATLRGTVRDQKGANLQDVSVIAKSLETGKSRTARTNPEGEFELTGLEAGRYELQVEHPGYASQVQKEWQLHAGQISRQDFVLSLAPEAPSGTQANLISENQLVGLPLNGRSYSQLATLQAGLSDPSGEQASRGVGGGNLTVAGGRPTSNIFLLDGTNIMDNTNRVPRSAAGVQLGSDAVFEVQVFSTNYSAEYGRGSGGVLNSITRSGSNSLHGSLFEYFRNSKLDARNFIDPAEAPPFKRNQFGFTITGPVRRDRTYFMAAFEAMRDRLTDTDLSFFPDQQARRGVITDSSGSEIQRVDVNPRVRPYLDIMPTPNRESVGGGLGINSAPQFQPTDENFWSVRLDHKISGRDSLFSRYTFDNASSIGGDSIYLFQASTKTRQQYLTLVESHIFSLSFLNVFRFGYTRPVSDTISISSIEIPRSLYFVPDALQFGQIEIPGTTAYGPPPGNPERRVTNTFQFADDLVAQKGPHALKFGLEVHRYRWEVGDNFHKSGVWSFNSLAGFLQGGPDGTNLGVALPGSNNRKSFRQTLAGFYIQDNYRATSNLRVNLGLRYEFASIIGEKDNRIIYIPDVVHDKTFQMGHMLKENPSLLNFSPRLSLTWSPWNHRNTVLSGGFGIYYDPMLEYVIELQKNSAPYYKRVVCLAFNSAATFPSAVAAAADPFCNRPHLVEVVDYNHMSSPMVLRYNFGLQQILPGGWRIQATYVGARGNHLFRGYEANLYPVPLIRPDGSLFFPSNSGPVNPAFSAVRMTSTDAQSFYNALQLTATKSLGTGVSLQASYTFSKSVDDVSSSNTGESQTVARQYHLDRTGDRGLSDFDFRHRLAINYFYALPAGPKQRWLNSGMLSPVLGGWRLGGILSFRTGSPFQPRVNVRQPGYIFTANRPNLRPGFSNNPTKGVTAGCTLGSTSIEAGQQLAGPDRYFDPCAFTVPELGTLGNVGRNTMMGPGLWTMDVSFQKDFVLGKDKRLQFRMESFNVLNRNNFGAPAAASGTVFSGTFPGRLNSSAGRSVRILTNARQIQFALRLSF